MKNTFFAAVCLVSGIHFSLAGGIAQARGMDNNTDLPTEADCRVCHEDLDRFPFLVESNVNKHHFLIDLPVILPTAPPDAIFTDTYECLSCHPLAWDTDTSSSTIPLFRDCLVCHPVETVSGSPGRRGTNRHHQLAAYTCKICHDDGHR